MGNEQICPLTGVHRLLVATDNSPFSEGALRESIRFAKRCSSRVYAMSVIETNPEYETIGSKFYEREEEEIARHLQSVKARAAQADVTCETVLVHGENVYRCIIEEAIQRRADMIVVGRHGRKALTRLLMGEVAAKVIGGAPCKVLVVPKDARIEFRTILVATDGSGYAEAAVTEAINIAKRCGSRLVAVSAMRTEAEREEAETNMNRAVELARSQGIRAEGLTPAGRTSKVIIETAGGRGADLIIMGAYGKTGRLKQLLMGGSTERVIGAAACAVLVVKTSSN